VISVALRKKGGEFDAKSWALVTFSTPEAAGRALFGKVRPKQLWILPGLSVQRGGPRVLLTRDLVAGVADNSCGRGV
jgi:hypothetical protein